jgi:hypothetical protein
MKVGLVDFQVLRHQVVKVQSRELENDGRGSESFLLQDLKPECFVVRATLELVQ